nr:FAS1 domain-containing protein SELMODRAFT_448915-like [Ipomoea batatas]
MEGSSNVFPFQIHDRRSRTCCCFSIPRPKLILIVAMLCLFFLWWLIFNSVRLEIKDGRIGGSQRSELEHLEEFFSDFSAMDGSLTPPPETAGEPVIKEDETQASFVSLDSGITEIMKLSPLNETKLGNIIRALRGAGDFAVWAKLLSSANISSLPLSATLFIPGNDAISHLPTSPTGLIFDPLLIPYHIVPQRLPFAHLQRFKLHDRLPTLLPSNCILITNNSLTNFTIDDARITHPDIFQTAAFSVHGINRILKYSTYGDQIIPPPPLAAPPISSNNNSPDNPQEILMAPVLPPAEVIITTNNKTSGSVCLCTEFPPLILSVLLFLISRFMQEWT